MPRSVAPRQMPPNGDPSHADRPRPDPHRHPATRASAAPATRTSRQPGTPLATSTTSTGRTSQLPPTDHRGPFATGTNRSPVTGLPGRPATEQPVTGTTDHQCGRSRTPSTGRGRTPPAGGMRASPTGGRRTRPHDGTREPSKRRIPVISGAQAPRIGKRPARPADGARKPPSGERRTAFAAGTQTRTERRPAWLAKETPVSPAERRRAAGKARLTGAGRGEGSPTEGAGREGRNLTDDEGGSEEDKGGPRRGAGGADKGRDAGRGWDAGAPRVLMPLVVAGRTSPERTRPLPRTARPRGEDRRPLGR